MMLRAVCKQSAFLRTGGRSNDNRSPRGACRAREAYYSGYKLRCPARTTPGKRKNWQKNFPAPIAQPNVRLVTLIRSPHAHSSYSVLAPQTPYLSNNNLVLDLVGNTTHAWFLPHFRPDVFSYRLLAHTPTSHYPLALSSSHYLHIPARLAREAFLHWSMHTSHTVVQVWFSLDISLSSLLLCAHDVVGKFQVPASCSVRYEDSRSWM